MVVDEPEEPIFVILQIKQTTSGGIRQSHSDAFVSFYLKCISPLYHNEQSKLPVQSWGIYTCHVVRDLVLSLDHVSDLEHLSTAQIVGLRHTLHDRGQVCLQPSLDCGE
jgi:hypothetical protein